MAACPPVDGDGVEPDNFESSPSLEVTKHFGSNCEVTISSSDDSTQPIDLDGEKAYDTVANYNEYDLRKLLDEVVCRKRKNDKSSMVQLLIKKEEDALKEESGSGEDTNDLLRNGEKRKKISIKKESAASGSNTGGSLGSLHNLSDPKIPDQKNITEPGVASRSRAGGSCGNLSKGSFERKRRPKEAASSRREGGSLQNLSKTEAATNESKRLHKSGSLSEVRMNKNRRQKTSSECSGSKLLRRSEDREASESSEEGGTNNPYQPLIPSSHSSVSGHSFDQIDGLSVGMVGTHCIEDHVSDAGSDEIIEDDEESDTELHTVTAHTAHKDLPSNSTDSDVDKTINFGLNLGGKIQDEAMTSGNLVSYPSYPFVSVLDGKSCSKDDDSLEKRKLRSTKSDCSNFEKSALDVNGNPVMTVRSNLSCNSSSSSTSVSSTHNSTNGCHSNSLSVSRRNGFASQPKDISNYDRLKAKADKKKANKEKDVIAIEKTPGFRGDESLDTIFKFLGVDDNSSGKSRKKNKGKKEDAKEERDISKRKGMRPVNMFGDYLSSDKEEEDSDSGMDCKEKSEDGSNKKTIGRKGKDHDKKELKKNSSSVEDLVSKSKQSENVKDVRKQMTVDDGDMSSYNRKKPSQITSSDPLNAKSEFAFDFYNGGDTTLEPNTITSVENGDFLVVKRRKCRKPKDGSNTVSQAMKYGGSGGWNGNFVSCNNFIDDHRRSTFPRVHGSSNKTSNQTSSYEKPQMNFSEAPRTVHEGTFISQWAGNRNGGAERGFPTTTSAPHSEDSDSDGGDSVHSMPAHTVMPSSTDSTPQTSYANITKVAGSSNKTPGKKGYFGNALAAVQAPSEEDSDRTNLDDSDLQDLPRNEPASSILDDNFPPLAETINTPTSSLISSKANESRSSIENSFNSSLDSSSCKKESKIYSSNSTELNNCEDSKKANIANSNLIQLHHNTLIINSTKFGIGQLPPQNDQAIPQPAQNSLSTFPPLILKPTVPLPQTVLVTTAASEPKPGRQLAAAKPTNCVKPASADSQSMSCAFTNNCLTKESSDKNKVSVIKDGKISTKNKNVKDVAIVENGNSRFRKFEEAVVFADNAKFDHSITGIEFGFDVSLDNLTNLTDPKVIDNNNGSNNVLIDKKIKLEKSDAISESNQRASLLVSKKDFSKLFQAPKNDVISYNYEEICKHVSKAWETTLRMLEEDPKNIQYWKATETVEEVN